MERNIQKNGLVNLLVLVAVSVLAYAAARYANAFAGQITTAFLTLGVLVAAVSYFQMGLEERERLEKLEFDEMTRGGASSALFDTHEAETFPARRVRAPRTRRVCAPALRLCPSRFCPPRCRRLA